MRIPLAEGLPASGLQMGEREDDEDDVTQKATVIICMTNAL